MIFGEKSREVLLLIHHLEENVSSGFHNSLLKSIYHTVEKPKNPDESMSKKLIENFWKKINNY